MSIWEKLGFGGYKGFSHESDQLLRSAVELAGNLGCEKADTGHLLLAILQRREAWQVIDTVSGQVTHTLQPGRGILHMEFLSKGHEVWLSARDDNRVVIYDTATKTPIGGFDSLSPSGIFFTTRAARTGF